MVFFFWGGAWPTANFTVSTIEKMTPEKMVHFLSMLLWNLIKRIYQQIFGILSNESINKSMNNICSNVMECLPIHFPNNLNQPDIGNYSSSIGAWWKIPTTQTTIISQNISFYEITVQQPAAFFSERIRVSSWILPTPSPPGALLGVDVGIGRCFGEDVFWVLKKGRDLSEIYLNYIR